MQPINPTDLKALRNLLERWHQQQPDRCWFHSTSTEICHITLPDGSFDAFNVSVPLTAHRFSWLLYGVLNAISSCDAPIMLAPILNSSQWRSGDAAVQEDYQSNEPAIAVLAAYVRWLEDKARMTAQTNKLLGNSKKKSP